MGDSNERHSWVRRRIIESLQAEAVEDVADELRLAGRMKLDPLALALAVALRRAGDLKTVSRLAIETGTDRRRLAEWWRRLPSGSDRLHLSDFLDLLLLLRGCAAYRDLGSWSRVGHDLGVHVRTLRRIATLMAGLDLGEIRDRVPPELAVALATPIAEVLHRR